MKPEVISSSISNLMQSLSLQKNREVSWHLFLTTIMGYVQADKGQLSVESKVINTKIIEDGKGPCIGPLSVCWELDTMGSKLVLIFRNDKKKEQAELFWGKICEQVMQIFHLGWQWQEKQNLKYIVKSCGENMNVFLVNLDSKGSPGLSNTLPEGLLNKGLFKVVSGCLQLASDPAWLSKSQRSMLASDDKTQSIYKVLQVDHETVQCLLMYRRDIPVGWGAEARQFTLMVCSGSAQPTSSWLKSRFNISEAEAIVASWFAMGLSAEEVADKTGYTISTVYSYIKKLYGTLGIKKQSQLTAAIWPELPH